MKWADVLAPLCILMSVAGCAAPELRGGPLEGRVLDIQSQQPISGAIVVVRWYGTTRGYLLADSRTWCLHVETATTDEAGHYRIPLWTEKPKTSFHQDGNPITVYKAGYSEYAPKEVRWTDDYQSGRIRYLEPLKGTREERFKAIRISGVKCNEAGETRRNLIPLYHVLYEQLHTLAVTKEEKLYANSYLNAIETIELPYDEATRRDLERREKIRHERQ